MFSTTPACANFNAFRSSDSLPTASVSDADVHKVTRRLWASKSAGLDGIPTFIIKGCLDVLIPVLKFTFILSQSQRTFLTLWKQAAIVRIFREGKTAIVNNCRPISIPNTFQYISNYHT